MHYGISKSPENFQQAEVLVVGIFDDFESKDLPLTNNQLTQINLLAKHLSKAKQHRSFYTEEGQCVIVIHCGDRSSYDILSLKNLLKTIFERQEIEQALSIHLLMPTIEGLSNSEMLHQLVVHTDFNLYQFNHFKTNAKEQPTHHDKTIRFYMPDCEDSIIAKASALCHGIRLTRDLANHPSNVCTPSFLAETAKQLEKQFANVACKVMGKKEMKEMGMNLLLSVSQGSSKEPQLIELTYENGGAEAPIVLVGKGITFDTGGYSIKPREALEEMKFDMCGAATVIGVIKAIAEAKLPVNVVGIIAATENLVNSEATKPGDVFTSMSGKTVEIVNTDAEGRLILADALTYAERFKPAFVIDIATLTGAIVISLGSVYSGIFSQDEQLANDIMTASKQTQDLFWRMPIHQEYADMLSSPVADMANATWDRSAGAITAAWFLSNFTKKYRWAHCDIAGTAYQSGKKRNATGRPVSMLFQLIENQVKQ
ncbi:leucyl aminopeptidase [Legionella sp. W05-934-2]|jgi:leucyl aminopeptidase|uniref:leucyl aminopeptidase n=1 Tax=Legionella sp. W05-934-2 TaxID=1198649 RepID=UPI0034623807